MTMAFNNQQELNKIIGRNLKNLQRDSPFTQAEFMEVIGFDHEYPQQYFQKIVRGDVGLNIFTLIIIQRTFDITLDDLIKS